MESTDKRKVRFGLKIFGLITGDGRCFSILTDDNQVKKTLVILKTTEV